MKVARILVKGLFCLLSLFLTFNMFAQSSLIVCGDQDNDLLNLLVRENYKISRYDTPEQAVTEAPKGSGVLILADGYPSERTQMSSELYDIAKQKKLRLYVEYPSMIPGQDLPEAGFTGKLERGVITSDFFGKLLPQMSLLEVNDCHLYPVKVKNPLIVYAKVAGFDKAEYGLTDTDVYPLLFKDGNRMIATSSLSCFYQARYSPNASWKTVWEKIISWVVNDKKVVFDKWTSDPSPMYSESAILPNDAKRTAVKKGSEWFFNAHLLLHPSWKDTWLHYQGDGAAPFGPPIGKDKLIGNGSMGILEGHASTIYYDGTQQYRYWNRTDVQGEVSFALAAAGDLLQNEKYKEVSENLIDFIFYTSNAHSGARNCPDSAVYGLLGWSETHPYVFYNDDNARAILGVIGASAFLQNERWNKQILENIFANFRMSSQQGFLSDRLEQKDIQKNGWQYYSKRDLVNPHPHFESWMLACYLWLYDKTGYKPLYDKAEMAIRAVMDAYPDNWKWTNGIQQERARMVLPLAWLVRVSDTPEHRQWLDIVVSKLLESQQANGAIREELGSGSGQFGRTKSNKAYGLHEAPLIFENGDEVSDMLYTSNFAFFALNEAAQATGDEKYKEAVNKLADFLVRIQVNSKAHTDIDGAWFRAFDYGRWDYWASNADAGWGAWCTLSGWIQSWIVGTQALVEQDKSYWDATGNSTIGSCLSDVIWMLDPNQDKKNVSDEKFSSQLVNNLKQGKKQKLVIYGTSLSTNEIGSMWVKELDKRLNDLYDNRLEVCNQGQSGQHSEWALQNLKERVLDLNPNTVILEFTANDAVERFNISPAQCKANTEAMIKQIREMLPNCEIILHTPCGMPAIEGLTATPRPKLNEYNDVYKDLAKKNNFIWIDESIEFKDLGEKKSIEEYKKYQTDGVHPTQRGAFEIILPNVQKALLTGRSTYDL